VTQKLGQISKIQPNEI